MASLKEVKSRISSVQSTQQITKAMKMVAAAKLRRAQEKVIQLRPYSNSLLNILKNLITDGKNKESILLIPRNVKRVLLIVVGSDRGLCGSFNSSVIKSTTKLIEDKYKRHYDICHPIQGHPEHIESCKKEYNKSNTLRYITVIVYYIFVLDKIHLYWKM